MQPMLRAGLCVLLLLAVTHPSAMVHAAGGGPSGSGPDTAGGDTVYPRQAGADVCPTGC